MKIARSINPHLILFHSFLIATSAFAQLLTLSHTNRDELATAFRAYHTAKDVDALMSLRFREGVPEALREMETKMFEDTLSKKITSISFSDVPDETKQLMKKGIPYQGQMIFPNLEVEAYMVVEFEKGEGLNKLQMPIGQKDGVYYIASTAPRP